MTSSLPIAAAAAPETERVRRIYLRLAVLSMSLGFLVMIEPAPIDVLLTVLLGAGAILRILLFTAEHRVPVFLLVLFFVASAVATSAATDLHVAALALSTTTYLILSWFVFVGISGAYGPAGIKKLLEGYAAAGWLAAASAVLAFFKLVPFASTLLLFGRAKAFFKDPNVFGPYLVPVVLYALLVLQRRKIFSFGYAAFSGLLSLAAVGIFLSFSRAAWINCVVALASFVAIQFVYAIRNNVAPKGMFLVPVALGAITGALLAVAGLGGPSFTALLSDRLGNGGLHSYDGDRFENQWTALNTALDHPIGIGPGQSEVQFELSTHNMYLRVLAEAGFLGFLSFYAFVVLSILRAGVLAITHDDAELRDIATLVTASLLGLLVNGFTIDTIHWRSFWFLLGLAWSSADNPWVVRSRPLAVRQAV